MKLRDFVERLQSLDPELPVCIADWSGNFLSPSEKEAEYTRITTDYYNDDEGSWIYGTFLQIGDARG